MACDETPGVKISLLFPRKIQIFKSTPFPWQSQKSLGHPRFEKKIYWIRTYRGLQFYKYYMEIISNKENESPLKKDIVEFDKQIDTNLKFVKTKKLNS